MSKAWAHFCTITHHKILVMEGCFKVGLYRQGLLHDMSKYHPVEFWSGVKYYQGTRSPNSAEREAIGYSAAWLHHKGKNKHHLEYWLDYSVGPENKRITGMKMPERYVVEMFMDRIAASKVYMQDNYNDAKPLEYYNNSIAATLLHEESKELLERLLKMLAVKGERKTFAYIRKVVLKRK